MAKLFLITLVFGLFASAILWLPVFLRPDAREIREQARAAGGDWVGSAEPREYALPPPNRRLLPGGKVKVGPGDSLWSILKKTFPTASNEELIDAVNLTARANGLRNPSALKAGQSITVPPRLNDRLAPR